MATHHEYTDPYTMPLGELLTLTKTNVTPGAELGYEYAKIALERSRDPKEATNPDKTAELSLLEVKAARRAGFRGAQAGEKPEIVWHFFSDSLAAVSNKKLPKEYESERLPIYVAAGHAAMILSSRDSGESDCGNPRGWFRAADRQIAAAHEPHTPWDRLATINDGLWAIHESVEGNYRESARLALRGLYRARHAAPAADTPERHKKFVRKHIRLNMAAGLLAVGSAISFGPLKMLHKKIADRVVRNYTNRPKKR